MNLTRRILIGATVIPGNGKPPIPRGTVVIDGERISEVRDAGQTVAPIGHIIDCSGLYLLPGLIDAHVHITWSSSARVVSEILSDSAEFAVLRAIGHGQQALAAGITTLRDCGARGSLSLELKRAMDRGAVLGPRLLVCGMPITTTSGHMHYLGLHVDSKDEARKAVRRLHSMGVDFVKLVVTGGYMTEGSDPRRAQYSLDEVRVVVEEAHNLGLRVSAHVHGSDGCRNAIEGGVDVLDHLSWLGRSEGLEYDEDYVELAVRNGQFFCPAMGAHYWRVSENVQPKDHPFSRNFVESKFETVRRMVAAGIRVAAGTDAGVPHTPFGGLAQVLELAVREFGLTGMEAIVAGTAGAAEALGLGRELGVVEPGKLADIILVEGDPTSDIAALRSIRHVFKGGQEVARWNGDKVNLIV